MSFTFGDTTEMGFVKAIIFMIIGFVLKKDVPGIQQGLGIKSDLFLGLVDHFTNKSTTDGLQSPGCLPGTIISPSEIYGSMPDEEVGGTLE